MLDHKWPERTTCSERAVLLDFYPTVLCPGRFVGARNSRTLFTVANGFDAHARNAVDDHVVGYSVGTTLTQGHVVFPGSALIRMPLQAHAAVIGLQQCDVRVQRIDCVGSKGITVEIKVEHVADCCRGFLQPALLGSGFGRGLLLGVELVTDRATREEANDAAEEVFYRCLEQGLSFKITMGNILTLSPPLTIEKTDLDRALDILDESLGFRRCPPGCAQRPIARSFVSPGFGRPSFPSSWV